MDKNSFDNLASLIHGADLQPLLNVPSKQRKAPVVLQLFVTMRILGHYGNANTFHDVSALLRVSYGACDKYYKRIIDCLVIISQRYVKWPDIDERKQISSSVQADFCFPNCVGMIDGTVFPLFEKPVLEGEDYWCRKHCYGISAQIICDHERRIRSIYSGWPGIFEIT